jgi:hypothetical protein
MQPIKMAKKKIIKKVKAKMDELNEEEKSYADAEYSKGEMRKSIGKMVYRDVKGEIKRRNIDYGDALYLQLENAANEINVSSQALAKIAIQEWLDRYAMAKHYRDLKKKA